MSCTKVRNAMQIAWLLFAILLFNPLRFVDADWLIVNGSSCAAKNYPYFVSYFITLIDKRGRKGKVIGCGGSLVKPNVVLTAAHCCVEVTSDPGLRLYTFFAYSGMAIMGEEFEQTREAKEYIVHPKFNHLGATYDLCLIKVFEDFHLTQRTQLVKLATSTLFEQILEGEKRIEIMGYGEIWSSSIGGIVRLLNITLQCAENEVISTYDCYKRLELIGKSELFEPSTAFCTLPNITRSTPCQQDAGGPVMYNGFQVGLVSGYGNMCITEPVMFARVDRELEFITKKIKSSVHRMLTCPMLYAFIFFMNIF